LEAEGDVLVDGRLHLSTLQAVARGVERRRQDAVDPWSPEIVYRTQDFRVLLGIRYVVALAGHYGVRTELREGMPLPLGASEVTLEEMTSVYDGLVTGVAWDFPGVAGGSTVATPPAPTLLIAQVRDVDGTVLYEAKPEARKVASPETAAMTADILRNVVVHGTGRRAAEAVIASRSAVPLGGKSGTTNDYKNAAFLGYVPRADGGGYTLAGVYALGVYVGYDDNRSMDVGNIELAGANGALPAWIGAARGLQEAGLLGAPSGRGPGKVAAPEDLVRVDVESSTGLAGAGATILARAGTGASQATIAPTLPPGERSRRRRERAAP
jgi:membrane peptidoglycan carboxypeptidase